MCLSGRSHGPARIQTFMWGCEAALLSISTVCMCCMKTHTLPYILFHHRILPNKYFLNGSVGCTSIYLHSEIPHKIICNWSCNDSSSSSIIKNTHPVHPLMNPTHVCFLSKCASQQNVLAGMCQINIYRRQRTTANRQNNGEKEARTNAQFRSL